jgi:SAM-dependent methyltransferase
MRRKIRPVQSASDGIMAPEILARQEIAGALNWWIAGRRWIFAELVRKALPHSTGTVMEVGPGAGSNLEVLKFSEQIDIIVADADPQVLAICTDLGFGNAVLVHGAQLPVEDCCCDFVLAGDVLEHVQDHGRMLAEIYRVLKPGACAVITVPAFMSLWSEHDRRAGHQRRYYKSQLRDLVSDTPLVIRELSYFNWILFLPTLVVKKFMQLVVPKTYADATSTPTALNWVLTKLFYLDIAIARKFPVPFGVSVLLVVERPSSQVIDED